MVLLRRAGWSVSTIRKPKDDTAEEPGGLVRAATLDVRSLPGVVLEHFTARDVVSRWDVSQVTPWHPGGAGVPASLGCVGRR